MRLLNHCTLMSAVPKKQRSGLTVLELLVTMGMTALLVSLLLPAIHSAREAARQTQCRNNLRQIGLALQMHHDTFRKLPAGWKTIPETPAAVGWIPDLLPFLEQTSLKESVNSTWPELLMPPQSAASAGGFAVRKPAVNAVLQTPVVFSCPSDSALPTFLLFQEANEANGVHEVEGADVLSDTVLMELPHANYVGVSGSIDPDDGNLPEGDGTLIQQHSFGFHELTRGLSNVAVVSERTARRLPSTWLGFHIAGEDAAARVIGFSSLGPNQPGSDECEFDSRHPGCIQMLFADGHVQVINDNIDIEIYRTMARRQE